jgi:hypothetical protein
LKSVVATRAVEGGKRGSSRPIVVETAAGPCIVKLRGAAQGTGPLVAETIVGALADAMGLSVPTRMLVNLQPAINIPERDAELRDLIGASVGTNLGFAYLGDAREFVLTEIDKVGTADRAAIFWLDRFVMNPDRNARNTNLLWSKNKLWLIDHGASLGFQYDWSTVTEASPTRQFVETEPHLFAASLTTNDVMAADERFAKIITREVLERAVAEVPDSFILPLLGKDADLVSASEALRRRRVAYSTFLWKRISGERTFADPRAAPPPRVRSGPPDWVRRSP